MTKALDRTFMQIAVEQGRRARFWSHPNPPVGCALVRNGRLLGTGFTQRAGGRHAEIEALKSVSDARGATAYVTLEPCSHKGKTGPCVKALIDAGVIRVVVGLEDPNPEVAGSGIAEMRAKGLQVEVGLLNDQVERDLAGFLFRMRRGWGRITIKLAASLDGRTAMASGESKWITSDSSRRDVQVLRAQSDLIVTGIGAVLADDCRLTIRAEDLPLDEEERARALSKPPHRMVLDSRGRTPPNALILSNGSTTVVTTMPASLPPAAHVVQLGANLEGRVDLTAWARYLGEQEYNEILIEAGPILTGALIRGGWADRLILYQAPSFLGHSAKPMAGFEIETLSEAPDFHIEDVTRIEKDVRIIAIRKTDGKG